MHRRALAVSAFALAVIGGVAAPASATPPGANGLLVWTTQTYTTTPHLRVAAPDGSQARDVFAPTDGAAAFDGTFSPTAPSTVAYSHAAPDDPFSTELYVGDLATGEAKPLTKTAGASVAPAYSPDGTRIAFFHVRPPGSNHPPGPERIAVMNADGSGFKHLTSKKRASIDPDWSPDGTRIVYAEFRQRGPRGDNRLMIMNADGTGKRALTPYGGRLELNPKWLPDGSGVLFESVDYRFRGSDIERIAADGSGRQVVLGTPAFETNPVPSPDGTRMVFTSDRDLRGPTRLGPGFEVYTARLDGTDIRRITNNREPDMFPDWQRLPGRVATASASAAKVKTVNVRKKAKRIRITGDWLSAGRGGIWLSGQREIFRLNPRTGRRVARIPVPEGACEATDVGLGAVWTATCDEPGLTRIDPATNAATNAALPVSRDYNGEGGIGAGAGAVWVVTDAPECTACRLSQVDPVTLKVVREIPVTIGAAAVRVGAGSVWVTNPVEDVVQQIDPATGTITRTVPTGPQPRFCDVGAGALWVLDQLDGTVTRVDAKTGAASRIRTDVVGEGGDLTFGAGSVWARGSDRLLVRIDARRRRVVARYEPPSGSGAVIVGAGAVWISAHDINTVWRLPLRAAG